MLTPSVYTFLIPRRNVLFHLRIADEWHAPQGPSHPLQVVQLRLHGRAKPRRRRPLPRVVVDVRARATGVGEVFVACLPYWPICAWQRLRVPFAVVQYVVVDFSFAAVIPQCVVTFNVLPCPSPPNYSPSPTPRDVSSLQSTALPLLIRTPNGVHAAGMGRDRYVPNPGATSPAQVEMFVFLGKMMGHAMR